MAEETRTRILDACATVLAKGVSELSVPAVAREAGVSVPTVYRHFSDKKKLLHETALRLRKRLDLKGFPESLEELPAALEREFERGGSSSAKARAALTNELLVAVRREPRVRKSRVRAVERMLADALHGRPRSERKQLVWMITVLCSSWTQRGFEQLLGASPRQAAEVVSATIARLLGRDSLSTATARSDTDPESDGG